MCRYLGLRVWCAPNDLIGISPPAFRTSFARSKEKRVKLDSEVEER